MKLSARWIAGWAGSVAALALLGAGVAHAEEARGGRAITTTLSPDEPSGAAEVVVRSTPDGPLVPLATPRVARQVRAALEAPAPTLTGRVMRLGLDTPAVGVVSEARGQSARLFRTELR
ncbi:MAG: hypothetical protein IT374_05570 [Polyangiaceae bacterium]|nr:hypothetical protein [Polyangiaceae bacterium]